MSKTQSLFVPGSRDGDDERWGVSVKIRVQGSVAEEDAGSRRRERARLPSPSSSQAPSGKRESVKRLQTPAESSENEGSDSESEAEETDCSSSSEFEVTVSGVWDDDTVCDPDFDFVGADLYLKAGGRHFWVHAHMLKDFNGLGSKLDEAPMEGDEGYKLLSLEDSAEDVHGVLTVLYTKPYDPHDFDFKTLESCLNLATKYENLNFRNYAIQQLGCRSLEPIDEFRLGRDYGLSEWRSKSVSALSRRDEPLTEEEATILGPAMFSSIAAAREKFQYARGHREAMGQPLATPGDMPKATSSSQRTPVSRNVQGTPKSGSREQPVAQPGIPFFPTGEFSPRLRGES